MSELRAELAATDLDAMKDAVKKVRPRQRRETAMAAAAAACIVCAGCFSPAARLCLHLSLFLLAARPAAAAAAAAAAARRSSPPSPWART